MHLKTAGSRPNLLSFVITLLSQKCSMKDILIIRMKRLRNLKLGKKFQRKFLQLTVIGGVNCTEGLHSGYFGIFEENKLRSKIFFLV